MKHWRFPQRGDFVCFEWFKQERYNAKMTRETLLGETGFN